MSDLGLTHIVSARVWDQALCQHDLGKALLNRFYPKKILLISPYFPPYSPLGAVRAPMLAAYWRRQGHDIRVIATKDSRNFGVLDTELEPHCIYHIPYQSPGATIDGISQTLRKRWAVGKKQADLVTASSNGQSNSLGNVFDRRDRLKVVRQIYWQAVLFPDRYRHWIQPAVKCGQDIANTWMPDVVYSTCPPHSGHIVAKRLSRRLSIPWIAELRDLWVNNPYNDIHPIIYPAQQLLAFHTLRHATGYVTLTQAASQQIVDTFQRPTIVSYNGFDDQDFFGLEETNASDPNRLTIIHAGIIYAGRRDPTSLFQALAILGNDRTRVRVTFYHDDLAFVARAAAKLGVSDCIDICAAIPRKQVLRHERAADVLLLSRWANPADDGIIPGKLFEYIGARRPILSIGSTTGEAAEIVRAGNFGFVSNDPLEIARQLRVWIEVKRQNNGRLPDLDPAGTRAYLRDQQFQKINSLLEYAASKFGFQI